MTANSHVVQEEPQAAAVRRSLNWRREALRLGLVPLFVVFCYQFEWQTWRAWVTSSFLAAAPWFGVPTVRTGLDSFTCHGQAYYFTISCTALDAFFGSLPLLWSWRRGIARNLAFLAAYFVGLSIINLFRLEIGLVLFLRGVSWSLAHEAIAGVFYFGLFLWIARQRRWR